LKAEQD